MYLFVRCAFRTTCCPAREACSCRTGRSRKWCPSPCTVERVSTSALPLHLFMTYWLQMVHGISLLATTICPMPFSSKSFSPWPLYQPTHLAGALPRLLVLSTDTHSGRTLQHLPSPNLVNCPTSVSQYGLRYRLLLRDVGAVNINVIVPGVAGITTIAGVSVAGTSSPRRVSAPLVQLAPAALHKAHPHLQSSKLKVLHAHPLTHSQR